MNNLLTGVPFTLELYNINIKNNDNHFYLNCRFDYKSEINEFISTSIVTFLNTNQPNIRGIDINVNNNYYIFCNTINGSYLMPNCKWTKNPIISTKIQPIKIHTVDNSSILNFDSIIYLENSNKPGYYLYYRELFGFRKVIFKKNHYSVFRIVSPSIQQLINVNIHRELQPPADVSNILLTSVSSNNTKKLDLSNLPENVQVKIAQFIPKWFIIFHTANKRWCEITNCFAKKIICCNNDFFFSKTVTASRLMKFLITTHNITKLELSNFTDLTPQHYKIISNCINLKKLSLSGCKLDDNNFQLLSEMLKNLIELNIALTDITNLSLQSINNNLKIIKRLNLFGCNEIDFSGVKMIVYFYYI